MASFDLPAGTFFDAAVVHLVTTATLDRLRSLYPMGRFEPRRFRPNIIVATGSDASGFIENDWVGHEIAIGEHVRLRVTMATGRCVMTTLPQGDLPKDSGILRTAAQHNNARSVSTPRSSPAGRSGAEIPYGAVKAYAQGW